MAITATTCSFQQLAQIGFRIGCITNVSEFRGARNPSYKVTIDFGSDVGTKVSSAQLPANYKNMIDLFGKTVVGVVNLPSRRIAGFKSEVLMVGFPDADSHVQLLNTRGKTIAAGSYLSKLDPQNSHTAPSQIEYDDFTRADIRAATVLALRPVESDLIVEPNTDVVRRNPTTFCAELDLGPDQERKITTLIDVDPFDAALLIGTQVAVIINLQRECVHDQDTFVLSVDLPPSIPLKKGERPLCIPLGVDQIFDPVAGTLRNVPNGGKLF